MDRVDRIKKHMFDNFQKKKEWWNADAFSVLTEESAKLPIVVRKAMAIDSTLKHMPAYIQPDELIVGMAAMSSSELGRVFPEYATREEKEKAALLGVGVNSVWAHIPINIDRFLELGLRGYREKVFAALEKTLASGACEQAKVDEYHAMLVCLDAVRDFAHRYSKIAFDEALKEPDAVRRAELLKISKMLIKTPQNPPETFYEALQGTWLLHCVLQSTMDLTPIGRCDQHFYSLYKHDLENGIITNDEADILIASWLAKFSDRVQTDRKNWESKAHVTDFAPGGKPIDLNETVPPFFEAPGSDNYGIGANSWFVNAILGGQDKDGNDATNELTYKILQIWNRLELIAPVMSARLFKGSPQKLYDECAKILRCGSSEPALYNDETIIEGFVNLGIPIEEARNYSNDGCWETVIPGCTDHSHVVVESLLQLEYALHNGRSLLRNVRESNLDTGDAKTFIDFEQVYGAYIAHMKKAIEDGIRARRKIYGVHSTIAPDPLLSIFIDDCIENGLDVTNGGARYMMYPPMISGMANTVDSLTAIKKLVFDEKKYTMEQIIDATSNNFKDNEEMRQTLMCRAPKFGNDDNYVDKMMVRILSDISDHAKELQKEDARMLIPIALGTFEHYAQHGGHCGASPDGRSAGETISSNYSPSVGCDVNGATSAILSCTRADLVPYCGGCPLDLQINSNGVRGEEGVKRLAGLIRSFMDLGGIILTLNGVSEEMLRDAVENPEKYRGLRVRFGGYSGYFVALPPLHQEIVIERIKHGV